jgi:type II secretory pathway pseudopilin PulG
MISAVSTSSRRSRNAFSMIEMLLAIGIMSIMTSLVVMAVTNASRDASRMVARQQQAAVQNAVSAWVVANGRFPDNYTDVTLRGKLRSQEGIRATYNAYSTSLAKFNVISAYLDETTATHIISSTTNSNKLKSDALSTAKQYLSLPDWSAGSYPKVDLTSEP